MALFMGRWEQCVTSVNEEAILLEYGLNISIEDIIADKTVRTLDNQKH